MISVAMFSAFAESKDVCRLLRASRIINTLKFVADQVMIIFQFSNEFAFEVTFKSFLHHTHFRGRCTNQIVINSQFLSACAGSENMLRSIVAVYTKTEMSMDQTEFRH